MATSIKIVGIVQRVRFAGNWTDFVLKVGGASQREGHFYHFSANKKDFFSWLAEGDLATVRCSAEPPFSSRPPWFNSAGAGVKLRFPVLVEPSTDSEIFWGQLERCGHSHDAVNTVMAALRARRVQSAPEQYDTVCEWSCVGWRGICAPHNPGKNSTESKVIEADLEMLFARWRKTHTLRRLYNLQILNKELNGSHLNAAECYRVCRRNPFLVASLSAEKAALICAMQDIAVTQEMLDCGAVLRCLKEQLDNYQNLAVPEKRLLVAHPEYADVSDLLGEEQATTAVGVSATRSLVCLAGLYRVMECAASNIRNAPAGELARPPRVWNKSSLTGEQQAAVSAALSSPVTVITGRAGTGKTDVIAELIYQAEKAGVDWQVAVFTGKATSRVKEALEKAEVDYDEKRVSTIHRLLYGRRERCQLLIFDEASMVATPLFARLVRAKQWMRDTHHVFVGDPNQLPPISAGRLFEQIIRVFPIHNLTENFRLRREGAGIAAFADWVLAAKSDDVPPLGEYPAVDLINGDLPQASRLLDGLLHSAKQTRESEDEQESAEPSGEDRQETAVGCGDAEQETAADCGEAEQETAEGNAGAGREAVGVKANANYPETERGTAAATTRDGPKTQATPQAKPRAPPQMEQASGRNSVPRLTPLNFKVICPFKRETSQLNLQLRGLYGFGDDGVFCGKMFEVGERVIMTQNDNYNKIYNGEEGKVISVKLPGDTRESVMTVNFNTWPASKDPAYLNGAEKEDMIGSRVVEFFDVPARKKFTEDDDAMPEPGGVSGDTGADSEDEDTPAKKKPGVRSSAQPVDEKFTKASAYELEYAYALTVHKAQGSEWDFVMVVVPGRIVHNPLMSNPLLYTAITRAKTHLWVVAAHTALVKMARTPLPPVADPTHLLMARPPPQEEKKITNRL